MAIAPITITGAVSDFRGDIPLACEIWFIPSGPAMSPELVLTAKTVKTIPHATTGVFSVDLFPTDETQPATWYGIRIVSLDPLLPPTHVDFTDWKLFVPSGTAELRFNDLIALPSNPGLTWVSLTAPANPSPGTWWLETNPLDYDDPENTGNLYEWSK